VIDEERKLEVDAPPRSRFNPKTAIGLFAFG